MTQLYQVMVESDAEDFPHQIITQPIEKEEAIDICDELREEHEDLSYVVIKAVEIIY